MWYKLKKKIAELEKQKASWSETAIMLQQENTILKKKHEAELARSANLLQKLRKYELKESEQDYIAKYPPAYNVGQKVRDMVIYERTNNFEWLTQLCILSLAFVIPFWSHHIKSKSVLDAADKHMSYHRYKCVSTISGEKKEFSEAELKKYESASATEQK